MKTGVINLKDHFPFLGENGADPKLCYYIAEIGSKKRPSMIVCPGGGYWRCAPTESENVALSFIHSGFNAFVLVYSTNSKEPHHYPTQVREVAAAFEIIKQNAEQWGCDAEKIGLMGFSAGGHLTAHYSNVWDSEDIREVFPNSVKPYASAIGYPVISAEPPLKATGTFTNLIGHELTEEEIHNFSLQNLVTKNTPPTFIWHTSNDGTAPSLGSILYAAALAKNKVPFEMHIYPRGKHGLSIADERIVEGQLEKAQDTSPENLAQIQKDVNHVHNWVDAFNKWLEYTFK